METTGELMRRWLPGWRSARRLPEPETVAGGLLVRAEQPGRAMEMFVLDADDDPGSVVAPAAFVAAAATATWLTVATTRSDEVTRLLQGAGLLVPEWPEWLMSINLATQPHYLPPAPYQLERHDNGPVIRVVLRHPSGQQAARGQLGIVGTDAIPDRIETDPSHQRLGLGSAVMGALVAAALEHGARTGLLVGSAEGQQLYATLGWRYRADVLIGRVAARRPMTEVRRS